MNGSLQIILLASCILRRMNMMRATVGWEWVQFNFGKFLLFFAQRCCQLK